MIETDIGEIDKVTYSEWWHAEAVLCERLYTFWGGASVVGEGRTGIDEARGIVQEKTLTQVRRKESWWGKVLCQGRGDCMRFQINGTHIMGDRYENK